MAYEISEGAAAGAMWIPYAKLKKLTLKDKTEIRDAMKAISTNLKNANKVVGGAGEKAAYLSWLDPDNNYGKGIGNVSWDARVTAVIHGYSSALAAKDWMKLHHEKNIDLTAKDRVYLTGGAWDEKISWLKVTVNKWNDYNSSDLVVLRGHCYYGISLKKKEKASSADPPMINKSIMELLKNLSDAGEKSSSTTIKEIMSQLSDMKTGFFGDIVLAAIKGPLKGTKGVIKNNEAFKTQIRHPKSDKGWINLIDLKGPGKLDLTADSGIRTTTDGETGEKIDVYQYYIEDVKSGQIRCSGTNTLSAAASKELLKKPTVEHLFGVGTYSSDATWEMRQFVNARLGNQNEFFKSVEGILDKKVAHVIGSVLLSAVLKTELMDAIDKSTPETVEKKKIVKKCTSCHFGFSLITALGKYAKGKMVGTITAGTVKENPTIQGVLAMLSPADKRHPYVIKQTNYSKDLTMQEHKRKEAKLKKKAPPAKLFFTVGIEGDKQFWPVLDFQLRYKGSFSPWPQFLGEMTKEFITQLKDYEKNPAFSRIARDCGA